MQDRHIETCSQPERKSRVRRWILTGVRSDLVGLRCRLALILLADRLRRAGALAGRGLVAALRALARAGNWSAQPWRAGNLAAVPPVEWATAIWPRAAICIERPTPQLPSYRIRVIPGVGTLVQAKADCLLTSTVRSAELVRFVPAEKLSADILEGLRGLAALQEPVYFVRTWTGTPRTGVLTMTEHLECPQVTSAGVPLTASSASP